MRLLGKEKFKSEDNKNYALKLESGYSIHSFFSLLEQFQKDIQFCLKKQMKICPQWKTRMKSFLVSKAVQKWCGTWYQNCLFFSNYCGKSRNFTTINKWMQIWSEPIILKWNFVLCRRKIACKLWLKIWSLLWCTAIRNGGQIFFCSICSCTKIGATHTKTVEITSEKIERAVRNSITLNACNYHENQENTDDCFNPFTQWIKIPITFGY